MRQVFFRRQTRDGVSTSQHTVTGNEFLCVAGDLPAGASLPRSSPVCAKIHSYSLMVPASGLCQRPQRALVLLLTSQSSHSGGTAPWIHTAGWF